MAKEQKAISGASALFGAAFIYATFGLLIREMANMFGDIAQSAARFAVAAVIIVVVCLLFKKQLRLPLKQTLLAMGLGAAFATSIALFTMAVNVTTLANSIALLYGGSILSSFVIGTFLLKEKITGPKLISIALALAGLVAFAGTFGAITFGLIVAVASGLIDGVANTLRKKLSGVDRNVVLTYQFFAGTVLLSIAMFAVGEQIIREVSWLPIVATVVFAILQITLGNLLLYGFKHFDVNIGSVILSTEIAFSMVFGIVFFAEIPNGGELLSVGLILAGSLLATVDFPALVKKFRPKAA